MNDQKDPRQWNRSYGFAAAPLLVLLAVPAAAQFAEIQRISGPQSYLPVAVVDADVDGDGDLDIVAGSRLDDRVGWYENRGAGDFAPIQVITDLAVDCAGIAAGDMDGDGDIDVVSSSKGDGRVAWYENTGAGEFNARVPLATSLANPYCVELGDVDGDGIVDVVSASADTGEVVWLRGAGAGTFPGPWNFIGMVRQAGVLHAADFDGDGHLDIFAATREGLSQPAFKMFGNGGAGASWSAVDVPRGFGWGSVASIQTQDMDGDGDLDLAFTARERGLYWSENIGGAFGFPVLIAGAVASVAGQLLDMDADGDLDAVVTGFSRIASAENLGGGSFAPQQTISDVSSIVSSAAGDFNGDGLDDFVWARRIGYGTVGWLPSTGSGFAAPSQILSEPSIEEPEGVLPSDIDGDGDIDLLVSSGADNSIRWFEGDGTGSFSAPQVLVSVSSPVEEMCAEDLDGDGDLDLVVAAMELSYFENLGGGSFAPSAAIAPSTLRVSDLAFLDLDGDGWLDIAYTSGDLDKLLWSRNLGGGSFTSAVMVGTGNNRASNVGGADFDGDGDIDLLVSKWFPDEVVWFENLGSGSFGANARVVDSMLSRTIVEDVDADGTPDVVLWNRTYGNLRRGLGGGLFGSVLPLRVRGSVHNALVLSDVDLDGNLDVVYGGLRTTAFVGSAYVEWTRGLGGGTFDAPPTVVTARADSILDLAVADVDGDGDEDLITVSFFDETIGICENLTIDDGPVGTGFCSPAVLNSTGQPAILDLAGSEFASAGQLRLIATGLPAQQFGFFIASRTQGVFPGAGGSQGTLCLGGAIARVLSSVQSSGADGRMEYALDLTTIPMSPAVAALPGEVWNFQAWHRDLNPGATSNFSSGATITFR